MIPKIIHYCWFSADRKPQSVQKCIDSWHRVFPDYQIKCWGADSFDFDSVLFVKEAIANKKWAFASDYVRLFALYTEGGIYLDSDVQAWSGIDDWLDKDFFTGLEMRDKEHTQIYPEAAIMGSVPGNPMIKEVLDYYQDRCFVKENGDLDLTPIPTIMFPVLEKYGWKPEDSNQEISGNGLVLSTDHIANTNCERKASVRLYHLNNRSWIPLTPKEKVIRVLTRLGVKKLYKAIMK